jgi:hypothetical protein
MSAWCSTSFTVVGPQALKQYGFPVGPISLLDEVGIEVGFSVAKNLKVCVVSLYFFSHNYLPRHYACRRAAI